MTHAPYHPLAGSCDTPFGELWNGPSHLAYVRRIFNDMADEYDHLRDLWYPHTFGFIDKVLAGHFVPPRPMKRRPVALDVGCGTGIQSVRLASLGYSVRGVDISDRLLKVARDKLAAAGFRDAKFLPADAQALPFPDAIADCVNCCGPSLNFVPDWQRAISEMRRCLKPGGKLLLEVDGKWNFDLFWGIINAATFDLLGYGEPLLKSLRHLLPPWRIGHTINYPFLLESGETVIMPVRLFTVGEITRALEQAGFAPDKRWGNHILTNLIPSVILHRANPGKALREVFRFLARMERPIKEHWPFNAFGASLLILARKR